MTPIIKKIKSLASIIPTIKAAAENTMGTTKKHTIIPSKIHSKISIVLLLNKFDNNRIKKLF